MGMSELKFDQPIFKENSEKLFLFWCEKGMFLLVIEFLYV
ncbi:hypothetical protein PSE_4317 [Pseudovibrio sp. FO-BEG1]|nr:hypothetical protein PSE_4317 [Pseudovibrio sp. FO-BEG1]